MTACGCYPNPEDHEDACPVRLGKAEQQTTRDLFVIITMQAGETTETIVYTFPVPVGTRHEALLKHVVTKKLPEHLLGGVVLHYSVHPALVT